MSCKNICEKYKAAKGRTGSYYAQGYKRCSVCEIFIDWDGIWCPCCDLLLRTIPRDRIRYSIWRVTPLLGLPIQMYVVQT